MNILGLCGYEYYRNISFSFVHQQAAAYVALGHHVRMIVLVPIGKIRNSRKLEGPLKKVDIDGVEVYYIRYLSLSNYGVKHFNNASAIFSLQFLIKYITKDFQPKVIHTHTLGTNRIGLWLKYRLSAPVVITTHGSDATIPLQKGRFVELKEQCNNADAIAVVSSNLKNKLELCGTATPIYSILNGYVSKNVQSVLPAKNPLSWIQVGHLIESKRVNVTIQAFSAWKKKHPDAKLTIIGEGIERAKLEAQCAALLGEGTDAVRFLGQLPNDQTLSEMAKAAYFVMASSPEGFGIVYLEAMASGCITIGTENEGISDFIISGVNGFLVPVDNPQAITDVIESCNNNKDKYKEIVRRAREDVQDFTWEDNALKYIELFERMHELG